MAALSCKHCVWMRISTISIITDSTSATNAQCRHRTVEQACAILFHCDLCETFPVPVQSTVLLLDSSSARYSSLPCTRGTLRGKVRLAASLFHCTTLPRLLKTINEGLVALFGSVRPTYNSRLCSAARIEARILAQIFHLQCSPKCSLRTPSTTIARTSHLQMACWKAATSRKQHTCCHRVPSATSYYASNERWNGKMPFGAYIPPQVGISAWAPIVRWSTANEASLPQ